MKLVLLTHPQSLPSESMPRFAAMISGAMARRGYQVETWTSPPKLGRAGARLPFIRKWLGYVDQFLLYPAELRKKIAQQPSDTVFVVTDQALGMWVPRLVHRPHVIHCHDFLALKSALKEFPEKATGWTGRQYQHLIRAGFSRGKAFISVSAKTRDDLHRFLPSRPNISEVIYNGLNHPFRPMGLEERTGILKKCGGGIPDEGFILHVGGNQWYKNRPGVLKIYRAYAGLTVQPLSLVMIGAKPTEQLLQLAASIPTPGKVNFVSGLSNEQVNAAYAHAKAFLFPSLEEGFGWPIVEAMTVGCPVITTNVRPLTEVAGSLARLIPRRPANPHEEDSWAAGAAAVLNETLSLQGEERAKIISQAKAHAARFNSDAVLDAYEQVYSRVLVESSN